MQETRLRWLGHIKRNEMEATAKRVWTLEVAGKRPRGRPKLRWKDIVTKDMEEKGLRVEHTREEGNSVRRPLKEVGE